MGSFFEVRLPASTPGAVNLACRALDLIDELEAQLTVYRDDSEVSRLNATAHPGRSRSKRGLFGLLGIAVEPQPRDRRCLRRHVGGPLGSLGLRQGAEARPDAADLGRCPRPHRLAPPPARLPKHRTVAFDREGIRINLGSIGKGYAIDRAVELIRTTRWPTSALVHGGRSSLFALGSPPGQFGGRWEIALRNPFQPESPLGMFRLRNRALGTSGAAFQQFVVDGQVYGHIIDPRIGRAGAGAGQRDGPGTDGRHGRCPFDGLLSARARGRRESYAAEHPEIGVVIARQGRSESAPAWSSSSA